MKNQKKKILHYKRKLKKLAKGNKMLNMNRKRKKNLKKFKQNPFYLDQQITGNSDTDSESI